MFQKDNKKTSQNIAHKWRYPLQKSRKKKKVMLFPAAYFYKNWAI